MHHACPYCQHNLAKNRLPRRAPPGARRRLPLVSLPVCPSCKGLLQLNTHPSEKHAFAMAAVAICLAMVLRQPVGQWSDVFMPGSGRYAALGWLVLLCAVALWLPHLTSRKLPADWPRYVAWTAPLKH